MSDAAKVKESLRTMADGGFTGMMEMDTPFEWVLEGVSNPEPFYEHLPKLLPQDSVLYVEGVNIAPEVVAFYSAHGAPNRREVRCDTIYPKPQIYHVSFSADVSAALSRFAQSHAVSELCDHLKAYCGDTFLFSFHDAFQGVLRISEHVPSENIVKFCTALGVSSRREKVQNPNPAHARSILLALEQLERSRAPWFKRVWYWITGA